MNLTLFYCLSILLFFGPDLLTLFLKKTASRKIVQALGLISSALFVISAIYLMPPILAGFSLSITLYRIFNALRILHGRSNEFLNRQVSNKSMICLLIVQAFIILVFSFYDMTSFMNMLILVMLFSVIVAAICLITTIRTLRKMFVKSSEVHLTKFPTLSVCIPARNETEDLARCLNSLLATSYPKLEVIVLDDCSHDKTAEVIKDFSQAGVRFIRGEPPNDGWLGKNQAYESLLEAAQGEYLIFCGVDLRFTRESLHALVLALQHRRKAMISVMPLRHNTTDSATLVQPMRYWWEIALPRRLFSRPAVLSTCWAVKRTELIALGGFKSVKNNIIPESFVAKELSRKNLYSFLRAGTDLPIFSDKSLNSQTETAMRLRYPQLRKRIELVWLTTVSEFSCMILPFVIFIAGLFTDLGIAWLLSLIACLLLLITQGLITAAWNKRTWPLDTLIFPVSVLYNMLLTNISMFKYEFGKVIWKERNICIPVMEVYPHLPKI